VTGLTRVRVLLPSGYRSHLARRYPVVYLFHGAADDFTAWTAEGDAERITARYEVLVVMPDSGQSGGYVNSYNGGTGGPPEWERYHVVQLLPWIDSHFRTLAVRGERAVAGLSMGGFGAMSYAARHPDLFAAAASFSGAVDINKAPIPEVTPDAAFGPRATQDVRWRAHNPWDLAGNLRGVSLTIRTGNGSPGGPFGGGDSLETKVYAMSLSFHRRLAQLGIPNLWDDYGPGGHDWPYWQRDLRRTLPTLMGVFAHPKPVASSFTFTAVEPNYAVYGWSATIARRALEFSTLRVRGAGRFSLTGSGSAAVATSAMYRPGQRLLVRVRDASGTHERRATADRSGRVTIALSLGPSNRSQQFTTTGERQSITADVDVTALP
jgi:S-formylglutathione hydrolase FrmB